MGEQLSNSAAVKQRIAELRRQRQACKGKIERADATIQELRWKISGENSRFHMLGREIEALGGKVRR